MTIIIAILLLIIGAAIYAFYNQDKSLTKQVDSYGGIQQKYDSTINYLQSTQDFRITYASRGNLKMSFRNSINILNEITITEIYSGVTVLHNYQNPLKPLTKEWKFTNIDSREEIYFLVKTIVEDYRQIS